MRIAFLNTLYAPHGPTGGTEITLRFLARHLSERGHCCTVVTLTPERTASVGEVDGVPVHYLPVANVYWPHGNRPQALRPAFQLLDAYNPVMRQRLTHVLAALRPDVVHAHNLQGFSVSAWVAASRLGIPLVQTLHDYYLSCPRSTMWRRGRGNCATQCWECRVFATPRRRLSHLPAAVTSVSRRVLERLAAAGVFSPAQAQIIRGVNAADDLPMTAPRPTSGPLRLGFLGRLDPVKGLEALLDAVAGLPASAVRLSIAGTGAPRYEAALRARVAPGTMVDFLGHVAPDRFFRAIDLLVVPSVWEEPLGRVWHEALRYGVPSLVTPLGGLLEEIKPGRTGFVSPSPSADGLATVLAELLAKRWEPSAMWQACREAAADYAPSRVVGQYESVLRAAAGMPATAGHNRGNTRGQKLGHCETRLEAEQMRITVHRPCGPSYPRVGHGTAPSSRALPSCPVTAAGWSCPASLATLRALLPGPPPVSSIPGPAPTTPGSAHLSRRTSDG